MMRDASKVVLAGLAAAAAVAGLAGGLRQGAASPRPSSAHDVLAPGSSARRPNLLLVVYDARRRDDFSFGPHGNARGDTPFLARFAEDALVFENAVSPGCWTVPVHAAIFTGHSVCELGNDYFSPSALMLPEGSLALAERLSLAGYETVAWADHPFFYNGDIRHSLVRGFEKFDVINDFVNYASYTNVGTPAGKVELRSTMGERRELPAAVFAERVRRFNAGELDVDPVRDGDYDPLNHVYLARLPPLFERATYFERRYRDDFDAFFRDPSRPFFLFLNLHMCLVGEADPELYTSWLLETLILNAQAKGVALDPGAPGDTVIDLLIKNVPLVSLGHAPFPEPGVYLRQSFDNRFYDASFEALWAYLERRGLLRDTVTIVTSDHGMSFGEHVAPLFLHGGSPPFEYITQVPLVVRFPDGSPLRRLHGRRGEHVLLTDLFPTLLDLAGEPVPQDTRARSLLERVRLRRFEPVMVSECTLSGAMWQVTGYSKSVRVGDLKLIHASEVYQTVPGAWPVSRRLDAPPPDPAHPTRHKRLEGQLDLLYDLARDPREAHNLAKQRPAEVAALEARMDNWQCLPLVPAASRRPQWNPDAADTLRTLGYLGVEKEP
jgi:arylsulfatase A-like enzyme